MMWIRLALIWPLLVVVLPSSLAQTSPLAAAALAALPECALSCLVAGIAQSPCSISNQACVCTNQPLQSKVELCVAQNCTVKQALSTKNTTEIICGAPIRDHAELYINVTIVLGVLSGFFILLRLGFKLFVARVALGLDDWFILLTILTGLPSSVIAVHGTTANGLGKDVWTLTFDMITRFGQFFFVMATLYFAQVSLLKLSLLFFYLRIFPDVKIKRVLWATIIFTALFGFVFVLLALFQCQPTSFFWEKWDGEHAGTCLNINSIGWANAVISIVLDFWMLAIPLWQLRKLQLHWKKKVGVAIMFCTGTFVTVMSIIRLQSLITFANSNNPTWDNLQVFIWSTVEINIGMICTCMPTLRLILVRLFPGLGSTYVSGRYYDASRRTLRSTGRSRSRTVGEVMLEDIAPERGITCQRTYAVQYDRKGDSSWLELQDGPRSDFHIGNTRM